MEEVFSHVTLGRSFSDEYYEIVNNHVSILLMDAVLIHANK